MSSLAPVAPVAPLAPVAPVDAAVRIRGLDRLRGVALLGIAVANVRQLFLPWDLADLPLALGTGRGLAWVDWGVFHGLVDMKFLTLFSVLFGIGFALQGERIAARGEGFGGIYLRRVLLLALFGVAHGVLLYPAEVLLLYAVAGLLLLSMRSLSTDAMLRVGLGLLGAATIWSYQIGSLGRIAIGVTLAGVAALAACLAFLPRRSWKLTLAAWAFVVLGVVGVLTVTSDRSVGAASEFADAERALSAMTSGDAAGWPEEYQVRREGVGAALLTLHVAQYAEVLFYCAILLLWRTLGLFLVGAWLYRSGIVEGRSGVGSPDLWRRVAGFGIGIGLPLSLIATGLYGLEIAAVIDWRFPDFLHEASALLLAAGIGGAVLLSAQRAPSGARASVFEAAGRMALTNYLGQSLVLAALAERWGLGLYGRFGGPVLTVLAIAVFTVLALLSRAWLGRFRLGPLEWLWRCGTYGRWLPNRVIEVRAG